MASGATTYSWNNSASTSSISVSPNTTTNYTVTGITNGCRNSMISNVTVNTTPTVVVNSSIICSGDVTLLTPSGAATYSWSSGETTQNISVFPSNTTTYIVTGTTNGCSSSITSIVTVNQLPTVTLAMSSTLVCISD